MGPLARQSMVPDPRRAPPPNFKAWDVREPFNVRRGGGENAKICPATRVKWRVLAKISVLYACEDACSRDTRRSRR